MFILTNCNIRFEIIKIDLLTRSCLDLSTYEREPSLFIRRFSLWMAMGFINSSLLYT